jgi:hypothetical protein
MKLSADAIKLLKDVYKTHTLYSDEILPAAELIKAGYAAETKVPYEGASISLTAKGRKLQEKLDPHPPMAIAQNWTAEDFEEYAREQLQELADSTDADFV